MSDLVDRSVHERMSRLNKARDACTSLLNESNAKWQNTVEEAFREFRVSVVHMRREKEMLDQVEDKNIAWRFLCRLSKERPFRHDRCIEVIKILMLSGAWMTAFVEDDHCKVADLPPQIADEFQKRAEEVDPTYPGRQPQTQKSNKDPPRDRAPTSAAVSSTLPTGNLAGMSVVVQRCVYAKVFVDENKEDEIQNGLFITVSFSSTATSENVRTAARFLLTAKLSLGGEGQVSGQPRASNEAESVVELCLRGIQQGIVIMLQSSLHSTLEKDLSLLYTDQCETRQALALYRAFQETLESLAAEFLGSAPLGKNPFSGVRKLKVVAAACAGPQSIEMKSAGLFMHSFRF